MLTTGIKDYWTDWKEIFASGRRKETILVTCTPETAEGTAYGVIRYVKQNSKEVLKRWVEEPFKEQTLITVAPCRNDEDRVSVRLCIAGGTQDRQSLRVNISEPGSTVIHASSDASFDNPIFKIKSRDTLREQRISQFGTSNIVEFATGSQDSPPWWSWWKEVLPYTYAGKYRIKCWSEKESEVTARVRYLTRIEAGRRTYEDRLFTGSIEINAIEGDVPIEAKIQPKIGGIIYFETTLTNEDRTASVVSSGASGKTRTNQEKDI